MKPQKHSDSYFNKNYDTKTRFISYWHQIHEITSLNPKKVLEIGVGNGFVSNYLKQRKINVCTLDFDKKLNPDIAGNILNIPFKDNSFDTIACYEVLEHLPYENFHSALVKIFRVSQSYVVLSLPDASRVCCLYVRIPKIGTIRRLITLPRLKNPIHKFDSEHYWEIGKADYPLKKIIKDITKVGFKIRKTYRIFEIPYFRFFILEK